MTSQALDFPCNPLRPNHLSSSTTSDYFSDSTFDVDTSSDHAHKYVLLRRLNNIAVHLAQSSSPDDKIASALHAKLDDLENEIGLPVEGAQGSLYTPPTLEPVQEYTEDDAQSRHWSSDSKSIRDEAGATASGGNVDSALEIAQAVIESPAHPEEEGSEPQVLGYAAEAAWTERAGLIQFEDYAPNTMTSGTSSKASADDHISLFEESQQVLLRVSKVAIQLQRRREEMKHIHDLSITRAEKAAQRITSLESEVTELESDVVASASSLTYLKLQLKVLEVQADPYIPLDDRDGLRAGIQRWKLDWADADFRFKARRRATAAGY